MTQRPVPRILALLGITLLLHYLLSLLVWPPTDADVVLAWIVQPMSSIAGYTWASYVVWAIAVTVVCVRLRDSRPAPRVLWLGAGALLAASVGPPIVTAVGLVLSGAADPFGADAGVVLFVAMVTAIPFTVAALLSIVVVELGLGRSRTVRRDASAAAAPLAG